MNGEIEIRALFGLLRRQFRLVVATVIVIVAIAGIVAFQLSPVYTATALVLVDPASKNLLEPESVTPGGTSASTRIDSEVEILRSDSLLMQVIQSERLSESPEWGPRLRWQDHLLRFLGLARPGDLTEEAVAAATLTNLKRAYTVERRALTQVIAVRVQSEDPDTAADLSNTIAETYIARQLDSKVQSALAARELLLSRLVEARAELTAAAARQTPPPDAGGLDPLADTQRTALARSQYDLLLQRAEELDAEAALQLADSRIVSPALTPQIPSFPNKTVILVVAALFSLGIGIALAFLRENLVGGFTSEEQLLAVLKPTAATTLPRNPAQETAPSLADMMVEAPLAPFSEAVRRLRATLDYQRRGAVSSGRGQVIALTSAASGEGKTTLALALARAYALSGRTTLLIDCDLRAPGLHKHFNGVLRQGLRDLLANRAKPEGLASLVAKDPLTEATLIGGATLSDIPTDQLLAGSAFARLIEAARTSFEIVILDTPALGHVVDALYAAPHADMLVFLTRSASTSQTDARKALEALNRTARPGTPLIAALNQLHEPGQRAYPRYQPTLGLSE